MSLLIRAVSRLTESEFIAICRMTKPEILRILWPMTFPQQMMLRRDIQISLARYSKGKPVLVAAGGEVARVESHDIQLRALSLCQLIERRVRNAYLPAMTSKIILRYPYVAKNPQKVKSLAKAKWSRFCVKHSY